MNTVFDGEATDPGNYMAVLPISGLFIFQAMVGWMLSKSVSSQWKKDRTGAK